MIRRFTLLCLGLLLMASGTANAARGTCPVAEAQRAAEMSMAGPHHADCDMMMDGMDSAAPAGDMDPVDQQGTMDHSGNTSCCCPAIVAALPDPALQAGAATRYPPIYDTPLNTVLISLSSVPEPPPPRA